MTFLAYIDVIGVYMIYSFFYFYMYSRGFPSYIYVCISFFGKGEKLSY